MFHMFIILRLALVSGLKWVDEVIANAPYAITEKFMNSLFNEHKIDYIIHGDDPCLLPDGTDAYALAKKAGRYKQIKRTEGVSSTDIVGTITSLDQSLKLLDNSQKIDWLEKTNMTLTICLGLSMNILYFFLVECMSSVQVFDPLPILSSFTLIKITFLFYFCF